MDKRHTNSGPIQRDSNGLTEKQEEFIQEMVRCKDMLTAYRRVYDTRNVSKAEIYKKAAFMVDRPAVKKRMAQVMGDCGVNDDSAYGKLTQSFVIERLKTEAINMKNPANVRVRALELLGKTNEIGLFAEKAQNSGDSKPSSSELEQRLLDRLAELTNAKH